MKSAPKGPASTHSRRLFLRGAGGFTLAVPFLSSLLSQSEAKADAFTEQPCFLYLLSPFGALRPENWYPSGELSQTDEVHPGHLIHHDTWDTFLGNGGTLSPVLEGLADQLDKVNILRGLDVPHRIGHSSGLGLGYYSQGTLPQNPAPEYRGTIDQVMAESSSFYDVPPRMRSLLLSYFGGSVSRPLEAITNDTGHHQSLPVNARAKDPSSLFNFAFGNAEPGDPEAPQVDPRTLLVDHAIEDYRRLRDHRRISRTDRQLLEGHMELFTELQQSLTATPFSCEEPASAGTLAQVIAAMYRCRITRVCTINTVEFNNTPRGAWHGWSHSWWEPASQANLVDIHQQITNQLVRELIVQFDALPESDGQTLLDNSLIYWSQEHGEMHDNANLPILTAGGAAGRINTGQYVDYRNRAHADFPGSHRSADTEDLLKPGLLHNRWLATCLQAMGLEASDYERSPGDGYAPALTPNADVNAIYAADYADRGQPVPVIWNG